MHRVVLFIGSDLKGLMFVFGGVYITINTTVKITAWNNTTARIDSHQENQSQRQKQPIVFGGDAGEVRA